jgi:hypothetical protein
MEEQGGHSWRTGRVDPEEEHSSLSYYEDPEEKWDRNNPTVA